MKAIHIKKGKTTHLYFQLQRVLGDIDTLNNPAGRLEANLIDQEGTSLNKKAVLTRAGSTDKTDVEDSETQITVRIPRIIANGIINTGRYEGKIDNYRLYIQDGVQPLRI